MSDRVPEDVSVWLRSVGKEPAATLTKEGRRELKAVLRGELMKPVWQRLAERLEGMKDRFMALDMTKEDDLAMMRTIQAESRSIIVVLEEMWEMTHEA